MVIMRLHLTGIDHIDDTKARQNGNSGAASYCATGIAILTKSDDFIPASTIIRNH